MRFAVKADELRIVQFLKDHWAGSSILAESPMIFEYQYMRQSECGFVLAEDESGEICGIKGFVPMNNDPEPDIAAALAVALPGTRPMLNMEMQQFLEKNTNCRMMCSAGLNPNTAARVYPFFRYKVDRLRQYYRIASQTEFRIAKIFHSDIPQINESGLKLKLFSDMESLLRHFEPDIYRGNMPYKDKKYISYRYFEHPVYHYNVYGVMQTNNTAVALMVTREIRCNESCAIRIVDYIGERNSMAYLGVEIDALLKAANAEYIDFYCFGMPDEVMAQAGFTLRAEEDDNIIPNYFEPYVQKNIDILFFCNQHENFLICKADGDQDRPSQL